MSSERADFTSDNILKKFDAAWKKPIIEIMHDYLNGNYYASILLIERIKAGITPKEQAEIAEFVKKIKYEIDSSAETEDKKMDTEIKGNFTDKLLLLVFAYHFGLGVAVNVDMAGEYLTQFLPIKIPFIDIIKRFRGEHESQAKDINNPIVLHQMGNKCLIKKEQTKAIRFFIKSAAHGFMPAIAALANIMKQNDREEKAVIYYRGAYQRGYKPSTKKESGLELLFSSNPFVRYHMAVILKDEKTFAALAKNNKELLLNYLFSESEEDWRVISRSLDSDISQIIMNERLKVLLIASGENLAVAKLMLNYVGYIDWESEGLDRVITVDVENESSTEEKEQKKQPVFPDKIISEADIVIILNKIDSRHSDLEFLKNYIHTLLIYHQQHPIKKRFFKPDPKEILCHEKTMIVLKNISVQLSNIKIADPDVLRQQLTDIILMIQDFTDHMTSTEKVKKEKNVAAYYLFALHNKFKPLLESGPSEPVVISSSHLTNR